MKDKLIKALKNPSLAIIFLLDKVAFSFPDKLFLKIKYYLIMKRRLNIKAPKTFNEKLQWLKLYDRKAVYIPMVDKVEVKKYIADIIGEEYIIPTLGVYNSFEEINFCELPNQFVLKTTHDSGGVVICTNKQTFDINAAKRKLNKHLKINPFYRTREWPYKNVKPRIIAESFMVDDSGYELKDYKFFCFEGEVHYIQVDFDRLTNHKRNIYNTNWELQNFTIQYPNDIQREIVKPESLDKMISFANKLSKGIAHLRVDFYSIKDKIYFGELTFYHGSGTERFLPNKWDDIFGSLLKLPAQ